MSSHASEHGQRVRAKVCTSKSLSISRKARAHFDPSRRGNLSYYGLAYSGSELAEHLYAIGKQ